jgi:Myb-like DNA-binding protein BAS1
MDLVQRLGRDWAAIARELPTRDRKRCRERFINHLDPALNRLPWSQAEDDKLRKLHRECGSQWTRLASELRGRSPEDTKNRWLHLTADDPQTRAQPQRWTVAETEALASLVETNGAKDWFFIASQIPGRTDLQCRQHWHRVLAPNISKGRTSWTRDQDDLLRAKVKELGPHWEQVDTLLVSLIVLSHSDIRV